MGCAPQQPGPCRAVWPLRISSGRLLVKRNGLQMSAEPNNLMGKNSFKFSGIANANAVGITEEAKGITFSKKNSKRQRQPARNNVSVELKSGFRKVARSIKAATEG